MTGFASKKTSLALTNGERSTVVVNLKSLNSRYFETNFRIPYPLGNLETTFTRILKKHLIRGYIYCNIHVSNPNLFQGAITPSTATIHEYIQAATHILTQYPDIKGPVCVNTILTLPHVLSTQEQEIDDASKAIITETLKETIQELIIHQEREGQALKKDLHERLATMKKDITLIEKTSQAMVEDQKEKVHATLQDLESDESKFAEIKRSALYVILDKIDIHEEVVRFSNHLQNLTTLLDTPDIEKGKRLDFTLQELAREINTIAAKCSNVDIGGIAINIKVEIEKAREQVQNIL